MNGHFFDIVVDDRLPFFTPKGQKQQTIAGANFTGNEFWVQLIEKAFAKLYGSYGHISGGHPNICLRHFTGGVIESVHFKDAKLTWYEVEAKQNFGVFFALSSADV